MNTPEEPGNSRDFASREKTDNADNERQLYELYGYMFRPHCSVRIMPGWMPLLAQLHQNLDRELGIHKTRFTWSQIGEQFGRLTLYYLFKSDGENEEELALTARVRQLTKAAADASTRTCQVCGAPGRTVNLSGYVMTGCEFHLQVKT